MNVLMTYSEEAIQKILSIFKKESTAAIAFLMWLVVYTKKRSPLHFASASVVTPTCPTRQFLPRSLLEKAPKINGVKHLRIKHRKGGIQYMRPNHRKLSHANMQEWIAGQQWAVTHVTSTVQYCLVLYSLRKFRLRNFRYTNDIASQLSQVTAQSSHSSVKSQLSQVTVQSSHSSVTSQLSQVTAQSSHSSVKSQLSHVTAQSCHSSVKSQLSQVTAQSSHSSVRS